MAIVISDDMVLGAVANRPTLCLDVFMIQEVEIDVHWQRCD